MSDGTGGWTGGDRDLRRLRTLAVVVILALLAYVIINRNAPTDLGVVGTLVGALLVALGFEAGIRWPGGKP